MISLVSPGVFISRNPEIPIMGDVKPSLFEKLGSAWSQSSTSNTREEHQQWRPVYWLYATILPLMLYAFEALKISAYWTARAPQVGTLMQMSMMLLFYALWIFIPRLIWGVVIAQSSSGQSPNKSPLPRLMALGLLLCAVHMFILTLIIRALYFPPDGPVSGFIHWIHTYGEVWLGNAGIWMMAYGIATATILYMLSDHNLGANRPTRYEVRQNGKTWSVLYSDIFWIKAAGNYTELHTTRGVLMVRKALSRVSEEIVDGNFLRSHRSALINGRHVVAIKPREDGSGFLVQLSNDDEAPLSRRKLSEFRQLLKLID